MTAISRTYLVALLLTALGTGCDSSSSYRAVVREQLDAYLELEEILATVKDGPSMAAAKTRVDAKHAAFDAAAAKARKLAPPSQETLAQIQEDAERLRRAQERVQFHVRRILEIPQGREFLMQFQGLRSIVPAE